ncbi:EF-P 5-aminopentanol modification-associated protein YfmH [Secundilactobacillus kimchicus]|uniref:EF-P 5-aminopentanol modification-associated protein YfmH n=1 Tax=Secundilactobacillus kimchicus TaxID=528209 RepID=UPI0024A870FB|nr:pitrilysin family protein [Secundilactobacillus kimchicus]
MRQHHYPKVAETLYSDVLPNGLTVHLLPKAGFHKTYAVFTTDYGSIDNTFVPIGTTHPVTLPAGIAHFLEHKMFEKEDHDAFDDFAHFGANSNAFTSYTHTSYLFSTTRHLKENLETLLDFVQRPYFTKATVEKEKGIIGQEIQMYDDDPNSQAYFGTIAAMYPDLPFKNDIAGTLDSIAAITADDLYLAHKTFYQPANMSLVVVGKLEPDETMGWIKANQAAKLFDRPMPIIRPQNEAAYQGGLIKRSTLTMPVERPKVSLGLRGVDQLPEGWDRFKYEEALSLGFDLLFGETASEYLRLYDRSVLDDSFGYNIELQRGAHFVILAGETADSDRFEAGITEILENAQAYLKKAEFNFETVKREAIGSTIASFNSLEVIANQYDDWLYGGTTIFDEVDVIEGVTFDDVLTVMQSFINLDTMSVQTILPGS